jgi:hypothetical protein
MKRYKSKSNPKLEFFVEKTFQNSYMIVSQVKGYEATEAHADVTSLAFFILLRQMKFANKKDAEEIAQQMANES